MPHHAHPSPGWRRLYSGFLSFAISNNQCRGENERFMRCRSEVSAAEMTSNGAAFPSSFAFYFAAKRAPSKNPFCKPFGKCDFAPVIAGEMHKSHQRINRGDSANKFSHDCRDEKRMRMIGANLKTTVNGMCCWTKQPRDKRKIPNGRHIILCLPVPVFCLTFPPLLSDREDIMTTAAKFNLSDFTANA